MRIGIFDSGLGGLFITKELIKKLPEYDYTYLGDTKRVPYGNRSQDAIYEFTKESVEYLLRKNCKLIILACNTASSKALRKLQKEYLPKHYPDRKILGVIIPTAEEAAHFKRVGNLATAATVASDAFPREIRKLNKKIKVYQNAAPLLVPIIENNGLRWTDPILNEYLKPLLNKDIDALILGCTHYPILKSKIRKLISRRKHDIKILSQEEIIPKKLKDYLRRHSEIDASLSRRHQREFLLTDVTDQAQRLSRAWLGKTVKLKKVNY